VPNGGCSRYRSREHWFKSKPRTIKGIYMLNGFQKMRYEVVEDDEIVCMTDCDVSAATTFAKKVQTITRGGVMEYGITRIEFRDNVEQKFVRISYELGEINA